MLMTSLFFLMVAYDVITQVQQTGENPEASKSDKNGRSVAYLLEATKKKYDKKRY